MTARTRSARRSNPQRMSVASVANQMRELCPRSSVCKLGSPIMTRTPPRPTRPASDLPQSRARPQDSGRCSAAPQSLTLSPSRHPADSAVASPPALPQTAASLLPAVAFSSSKTGIPALPAHGKTRPHSARFLPALQPDSATAPLLVFWVGSFEKLAASYPHRQDGVQRSLTSWLPILHY